MPSEMRPIEKHLVKQGCIVSVPMLAGHGSDHNALLATGWKDWMASAKAALNELLQQCDHVVVGGLSMGALISLMLAIDEPRVSGIVLLSTTISYDGQTSTRFKIFLPFVDLIPWLGMNCYWTESPPYGLKDLRLQKQITKQVEAAKRGESTSFGLFRTYAGVAAPNGQVGNASEEAREESALPCTCNTRIGRYYYDDEKCRGCLQNDGS